ncbi:MAG: glutamate racemase [Elusimicrobia bacterium]|nr:glutamate racemase [Elusimicrobiota bacterium]
MKRTPSTRRRRSSRPAQGKPARRDPRPIGIFDSGVGGLTVLRAIGRRLPGESLVYFGDTAHLPYGNKSPEAVTRFSVEVARFLKGRDIKVLVVACNTASALALPRLKRGLGVPVLGVIEPGARAAARATTRRRVGIIATEATVASGAYQRALKGLLPGVRSFGKACPLFVPLVEEGWWAHPVTRAVAREYLEPLQRAGVDTLILGCTHYPLLKASLARVLGPGVRLIDSAEETAREVEALLEREGLGSGRRRGWRRFFASDGPDRFLRLAKRLLGVSIKTVAIWRFD